MNEIDYKIEARAGRQITHGRREREGKIRETNRK